MGGEEYPWSWTTEFEEITACSNTRRGPSQPLELGLIRQEEGPDRMGQSVAPKPSPSSGGQQTWTVIFHWGKLFKLKTNARDNSEESAEASAWPHPRKEEVQVLPPTPILTFLGRKGWSQRVQIPSFSFTTYLVTSLHLSFLICSTRKVKSLQKQAYDSVTSGLTLRLPVTHQPIRAFSVPEGNINEH